ncbi:GID complex subunit 4, VID24, partial [Rhizopus stolonifer]
MPILSVTPNETSSTLGHSDTTMSIEKSANCCNQSSCKHQHAASKPDMANLVSTPIKPAKRNTSLVSRNQDDDWVDISNKRLRHSRLGALYDGSRFKGVQKCGMSKYNVIVDIQHVDLNSSKISGYLNIEGLTSECPELTTFFEGEIIGPDYPFLTRKWQAQQYIDALHWGKFPSFHPYIQSFNDDDFVYNPFDKDFIYMRWKEHFLVPDHCVSNIEGA